MRLRFHLAGTPAQHDKKTMNLRIVTIWTTGSMLLLTIATATISFFHELPKDDLDRFITLTIKGLWIVLMCSSCPLIYSWILAITLKNSKSTFILFVSTIMYGILYVSAVFFILMLGHEETGILLNVGILSFPVMVPIWIMAIMLNRR